MTGNDRFTKALGRDDQDVMNLRSAIDGLVFEGWSDDDIADGAREIAAEQRAHLKALEAHIRDKRPNRSN
ncbi:hypothetical protein [Pseudooceanicola atlanticus]|uniref:Uncharacterized protein n=1 Tax=Pseudooceanicola atlanticus TaxID=1461694 RepID=A0A0A0EK52_9RHOB|nr:hypothetical protein [Pseudooceanicola atlanticus]KGM50680.1 hypothetical protein ATO9_04210 [Pseudooceanicola atlanticus]